MSQFARTVVFPALLVAVSSNCWAQEPQDLTLPQLPEVRIHAHNAQGALLRNGLGFIWDDRTVVTSYSAVHGASLIKLQIDGESMVAGELISWSKLFDLAFLRTAEILPEGRLLGSSDTLAAGDSAYFFAEDHGTWKLRETQLKKWEDSGHGYVWLYLSNSGTSSASPLFNRAGKIVGWFPGKSPAIPLKAVFAQLGEKSTHVSLQEFTIAEKFWTVMRVPARMHEKKGLEQTAFKKITGPSGYPFQIHIPESWEYQTSHRLGHFLMLAISGQYGISLGLRIVPAQTGDLSYEIERAETSLFPGIARQDMVPALAGEISGIRAQYEDAQGFISTVFYSLNSNRLCVLSVTYPSEFREQMSPILVEVFNSLHFTED